MIIAVIPARGGSKRIPGKNIRDFCGKPIIQYSIEAAGDSGVFDRIIVSTDCDEIAAIATQCGAEVPFTRPAELSDSFTTTTPVVQHAIRMVDSGENPVEYACCIYGCAPFVTGQNLRTGLNQLKRHPSAEFSLPITTFPYPIFRSLRRKHGQECEMVYPEHESTRSQDLPEAWHDAGQFYWSDKSTWMKLIGGILSAKLVGIPIPRYCVQDIDTPEDWERAELMYELLSSKDVV